MRHGEGVECLADLLKVAILVRHLKPEWHQNVAIDLVWTVQPLVWIGPHSAVVTKRRRWVVPRIGRTQCVVDRPSRRKSKETWLRCLEDAVLRFKYLIAVGVHTVGPGQPVIPSRPGMGIRILKPPGGVPLAVAVVIDPAESDRIPIHVVNVSVSVPKQRCIGVSHLRTRGSIDRVSKLIFQPCGRAVPPDAPLLIKQGGSLASRGWNRPVIDEVRIKKIGGSWQSEIVFGIVIDEHTKITGDIVPSWTTKADLFRPVGRWTPAHATDTTPSVQRSDDPHARKPWSDRPASDAFQLM